MSRDTSFGLKGFSAIFAPPGGGGTSGIGAVLGGGGAIHQIAPDNLVGFRNHPFRLYTGKRFDDLVESIKERGILLPILVRPIEGDDLNYEILSGHNRAAGGRAAGLTSIPAIILHGLSDDEALLIVTETNLMQRSFSDMTISERALVLSMHYDAIKRQGRRTDLIQGIETLFNACDSNGSETYAPMEHKLNSREKTGQEYGLSKESVARYLRVNKLTDELKARLDDGELCIRAGVDLSYLPEREQRTLDALLTSEKYRVDMKKAAALRQLRQRDEKFAAAARGVLNGTSVTRIAKPKPFRLKPKIIRKYFKPEQKEGEIEDIIEEALTLYFKWREEVAIVDDS